jgi:gluconate 2-dehydrogenase gamma chain
MERRELLRWLAATAGLAGLEGLAPDDLLALGREVHASQAGSPALSPAARRTVAAAAERILPAGDTPGATDAGVPEFIDRMLADWFDSDERARFLAGIPELDRSSRARSGRDFADSTETDQVAVLTALDDELTALRRSGRGSEANRHWFGMLKYLTVWGYFTSEPAARITLGTFPLPGRFDGCAPYQAPA